MEIISDLNISYNKKYYNSKVYEIDQNIGIPKEALKEIVALISIKKHSNIANLDSYYDITSNKLTYGSKIKCSVLDKLSQNPTKKLKFEIIKQLLAGIKHLYDNEIICSDLTIDKLFLDKNNNLKISNFSGTNLINDQYSSDRYLQAYKKIQHGKKYIKLCGYIIGHILLGHNLLNNENEIQYKELDERYPEISDLLHKMISPDIFICPNIDTIVKIFSLIKPVKINSF